MTLWIDVPAARTTVTSLRAVVDTVEQARRDVAAAAGAAWLVTEHLGALTLLDELRDEAGLCGQVLSLSADRAETADSTYDAMLAGWLSTSLDALRTGINDGGGTSVLSLLAAAGGTTPPAWLGSLDQRTAGAWLASLPEAQRVDIAADADRFDGTAIGAAIAAWMDSLEGAPLREIYIARALLHAGIDRDDWNPNLGLPQNAAIVEAVYEYYAQLYRGDTDRLWWSGMAALIGPSFYAGFQDLDTFRSLFHIAGAIADSPLGHTLPPGVADAASLGSDITAAELRWYQSRLLSMQREIFFDMAAAHEAYLDGGVSTIERFYVGDPYGFGPESIEAWRAIDEGWRTGDVDMIADGNAVLLRREQQEVIADDYDIMRNRPLTGELVTWAMTLVGTPSVPGAQAYPDVFPLTVGAGAGWSTPDHVSGPWGINVPLPHVGVEAGVDLITPLPEGNISNFDDRWALIQQDTLPTYVDLARNHPDLVLDELSTPVGERASSFTIDMRIDDILIDLATDWSVDAELDVSVGW